MILLYHFAAVSFLQVSVATHTLLVSVPVKLNTWSSETSSDDTYAFLLDTYTFLSFSLLPGV